MGDSCYASGRQCRHHLAFVTGLLPYGIEMVACILHIFAAYCHFIKRLTFLLPRRSDVGERLVFCVEPMRTRRGDKWLALVRA